MGSHSSASCCTSNPGSLIMYLGWQWKMAQILGSLYPSMCPHSWRRPGWSILLLALAWSSNISHGNHSRSESADRRSLKTVSRFLCVNMELDPRHIAKWKKKKVQGSLCIMLIFSYKAHIPQSHTFVKHTLRISGKMDKQQVTQLSPGIRGRMRPLGVLICPHFITVHIVHTFLIKS